MLFILHILFIYFLFICFQMVYILTACKHLTYR